MNHYSYALLGTSCRDTLDSLVSNTKYLPPSDPVYNELLTRMYQYPSTEKPYCEANSSKAKAEPKKNSSKAKDKKPTLVLPKPGSGCSSCC